MDYDEQPVPFRWDIPRRERLGGLLADQPDVAAIIASDMAPGLLPEGTAAEWLLSELRRVFARTLALSANADLVFVGRSPESLYDLGRGYFAGTAQAARLHHLQVSLNGDDLAFDQPSPQRRTLRRHFATLGLAPADILQRQQPTAFVDLVDSGGTFGQLVTLLETWTGDEGLNWRDVARKIRLIGLTYAAKPSPTAWRWQQHASWAAALGPNAIKNIAIGFALYGYIGRKQSKMMPANAPARWNDEQLGRPVHDEQHYQALAVARWLYEQAATSQERRRLAAELSGQPAMRHRWYRAQLHALPD